MLIRPVTYEGRRLFHRATWRVQEGKVGGHFRGPIFIPPKSNDEKGLFRLLDVDNVLSAIRLYRWFWEEHRRNVRRADGSFSGIIQKEDLMRQCFDDAPSVSKVRVGRLLRMIVQYETNFQRNPSPSTGGVTLMNWRWCHTMEIIYGLEHLMALWLPRVIEASGGSCSTEEELLEELEIVREQTREEDRDLIATILERRIY